MVRSWLYVPGNRPDRFDKAASSGADAVIIDLEDAVPERSKDVARETVAEWLRGRTEDDTQIWVRVNTGKRGIEDVSAVAVAGLRGVCLPKVESSVELGAVDDLLSLSEVKQGFTEGKWVLSPLIESARGMTMLRMIVVGPRVHQVQLGAVDLAADLGLEVHSGCDDLLVIRSLLVMECAAARLAPPVAPVSIDFQDLEKFHESTRSFKAGGFMGRACIHPNQVAVANTVFTPSESEVAQAQDMIHRLALALETGDGVVLDQFGQLVDEATVRSARRVLSLVR